MSALSLLVYNFLRFIFVPSIIFMYRRRRWGARCKKWSSRPLSQEFRPGKCINFIEWSQHTFSSACCFFQVHSLKSRRFQSLRRVLSGRIFIASFFHSARGADSMLDVSVEFLVEIDLSFKTIQRSYIVF
jgi:hypothetical protein